MLEHVFDYLQVIGHALIMWAVALPRRGLILDDAAFRIDIREIWGSLFKQKYKKKKKPWIPKQDKSWRDTLHQNWCFTPASLSGWSSLSIHQGQKKLGAHLTLKNIKGDPKKARIQKGETHYFIFGV